MRLRDRKIMWLPVLHHMFGGSSLPAQDIAELWTYVCWAWDWTPWETGAWLLEAILAFLDVPNNRGAEECVWSKVWLFWQQASSAASSWMGIEPSKDQPCEAKWPYAIWWKNSNFNPCLSELAAWGFVRIRHSIWCLWVWTCYRVY